MINAAVVIINPFTATQKKHIYKAEITKNYPTQYTKKNPHSKNQYIYTFFQNQESMKSIISTLYTLTLLIICTTTIRAETFIVTSQQQFDDAHDNASANDSIIWASGTYSDIYMDITNDDIYIGAATFGQTIFNGASKVRIKADYITIEGFQFIGGDIGTSDLINTYGSYNRFSELNIKDYTCYKYLRIREECRYNIVIFCNFENRLNLDDQNILSILVDNTNPGYHKVQYCSFKNFDGEGNDQGIEPIRIGVSTQADFISRSLVEYCYFTQCNGDGELISSKARQNVYRYNTFEDNPKAELVLRHGSENIVYGNFFISGKGGVRVREGQNHYIYNNYFYEIDDRPIYLQNEDSDPLDNINIAFNTIVDCSEMILGGDGDDKPTNVTLSNNIFAQPDDELFEEATGTETWIGNIASSNLGIAPPASGITIADPLLLQNDEGYYGLDPNSPAIDAAQAGYAPLPQFEGMDPIDVDISSDLMGQERPTNVEEKDLGCNEFPHAVTIQPIATEQNTGPHYNMGMVNTEDASSTFIDNLIQISPNPAFDQMTIKLNIEAASDIRIDIIDSHGRKVKSILDEWVTSGEKVISQNVEGLAAGVYTMRASKRTPHDGVEKLQILKFIKN